MDDALNSAFRESPRTGLPSARLQLSLRDLRLRDSVHATARLRESWATLVEDPRFHELVLEALCAGLGLGGAHWWEMFRLRLLPRVLSRITIAEADRWKAVEGAFESGTATDADVQHAATFLILDLWLWVTRCYKRAEESYFLHLAELTRGSNLPELRVAHCLRDIGYGDKSAVARLRAMIRSKDPATRRVFRDAFVSN